MFLRLLSCYVTNYSKILKCWFWAIPWENVFYLCLTLKLEAAYINAMRVQNDLNPCWLFCVYLRNWLSKPIETCLIYEGPFLLQALNFNFCPASSLKLDFSISPPPFFFDLVILSRRKQIPNVRLPCPVFPFLWNYTP